VWVPSADVRDRRALVAQRAKMMRLATQARNRLHAVLHRHHILPPDGNLFAPDNEAWWLSLDISVLERVPVPGIYEIGHCLPQCADGGLGIGCHS